ncbi:MAG: hypothetical protein CMJ83_17445 [Planctomycetes bacterium]|nr:hypothetical protein [Planctomycetota bacterium]
MASNLLNLVERVRTALEESGTLDHQDLEGLLESGESRPQLDQALRFLHGRDAILIDAVDQSVHLRAHVSRAVLLTLAHGPLPLHQLAERSPVSVALCCDVLGWLEREGRVQIGADDVVQIRGGTRH